jgi:hypothetical protein
VSLALPDWPNGTHSAPRAPGTQSCLAQGHAAPDSSNPQRRMKNEVEDTDHLVPKNELANAGNPVAKDELAYTDNPGPDG